MAPMWLTGCWISKKEDRIQWRPTLTILTFLSVNSTTTTVDIWNNKQTSSPSRKESNSTWPRQSLLKWYLVILLSEIWSPPISELQEVELHVWAIFSLWPSLTPNPTLSSLDTWVDSHLTSPLLTMLTKLHLLWHGLLSTSTLLLLF